MSLYVSCSRQPVEIIAWSGLVALASAWNVQKAIHFSVDIVP